MVQGLPALKFDQCFLARALSDWSQELKMKMGLRLKEENWVALAAVVILAVTVLMNSGL
jgi:hypothetical protein